MDKFRLDSHKISYHVDRICSFLKGEEARPLYFEISLNSYCNHHCVFCHYNYLGHKGRFSDPARIVSLLEEIRSIGGKSVVFAGSGEPLLYENTVPAIALASELGLDVGMSTNGALLKENDIDFLIDALTWIRFSVNASTPSMYSRIHKTSKNDFHTILRNLERIVEAKSKANSPLTIGVQYILIPANVDGLAQFMETMKRIGVDYFVIKHFYRHPCNIFSVDESFPPPSMLEYLEKIGNDFSDENFSVIVRRPDVLQETREYDVCYGLPYIVYVKENGDVYSCFSYQHDPKTILGNIFRSTLEEIWCSERKRMALEYINNEIDKKACQPNCRHHQINSFLWDLKHPGRHVNFI